jgi:hypothetical protein
MFRDSNEKETKGYLEKIVLILSFNFTHLFFGTRTNPATKQKTDMPNSKSTTPYKIIDGSC